MVAGPGHRGRAIPAVSGDAWAAGPGRLYEALARVVVADYPASVLDRQVSFQALSGRSCDQADGTAAVGSMVTVSPCRPSAVRSPSGVSGQPATPSTTPSSAAA